MDMKTIGYLSNSLVQDYANTINDNVGNLKFSEILSNKIETVDAKDQLKLKYPNLIYNVLDASEFRYWNRLDFPRSEIFKENIDTEKLKKWKPIRTNATGYETDVQNDLLSIPQGAYSVIMHPDAQDKMEHDSKYAERIIKKIIDHFDKTIKINETLCPGCTVGMKQAVCIDKNGEVGLQVSITNGPDYNPSQETQTSEDYDKETYTDAYEQYIVENEKLLTNIEQTELSVYNYEILGSLLVRPKKK